MTAETNAERLEQIGQYRSNFLLLVAAGILNKKIITDFDWLFEQAERAQKLEAKVESLQVENGGLRELHERLEGMWLHEKRCLQEENAHLREAIERSLKVHRWNNEESAQILEQALAGETNG